MVIKDLKDENAQLYKVNETTKEKLSKNEVLLQSTKASL